MKGIIALVLMVFVLSCIVIVDTNKQQVELKEFGCNNFDGTKFLLSGGTGTPNTIDEVNYEVARLNWMCNE